MENRFDELTKAVAGGMPRRQALRRLGSLFGGALLASLALGSTARAAPRRVRTNSRICIGDGTKWCGPKCGCMKVLVCPKSCK